MREAVGFLERNEAILARIDAEHAEIADVVCKLASVKPWIQRSWWAHFDCIWQELCRQQGWPSADLKRLSIRQGLRKLLGQRLRRLLGRAGPEARPPCAAQSPLFKAAGPLAHTFPPELCTFETAYGFRLCTSGFDMWQPVATGHYASELSETLLVLRLLPSITGFVDVGANVGFFSLLVAQEGHGRVRVLACEPSEDSLRALRAAIDANELGAVITVLPVAVSDSDGEVDLHLSALGSGGHSINPAPTAGPRAGKIRVRARRLDPIFEDHRASLARALVKIDVEGAEMQVLGGAEHWLRGGEAPILLVEAWPASVCMPTSNHVAVVRGLQDRGCTVFAIERPAQGRLPLRPLPRNGRFEPAPIGNYLALPSWAARLTDALAAPVDLRVFSDSGRLRAMEAFVGGSLRGLRAAFPEAAIKGRAVGI